MIASLGMYDRPETAAANDALWAGIWRVLGYGPEYLDRTTAEMDIWQSPDLVFSQTCGMPYRLGLHETVQLVGTPDYGFADVPAGYYYSVFVVRKDDDSDLADYQDRILAYNEPTSQSGWAAPQNHVFGLGFQFEKLLRSGGHIASAHAVANRTADIAALDVVTWRLMCTYDALANDLKVIQTTSPTPGLPFITGPKSDTSAILSAAIAARDTLSAEHQKILGIRKIVSIDTAIYLSVRTPPT